MTALAFPLIRTVLVVDPDPSALAEYAKLLSGAGYRVITAPSFEDASLRLRLAKADALVTRVRLGAYNGLHLVIRAREDFPGTVAIVTDVVDDPVLKADAEALSAIYLVNPLRAEEILEILRERFDEEPDFRNPA